MVARPTQRRSLIAVAAVAILAAVLAAAFADNQRGPAGAALVRCLRGVAPPGTSSTRAAAPQARVPPTTSPVQIRVNQVGYVTGCSKLALVMSRTRLDGAPFALLDASGNTIRGGRLGPSRGPWSTSWPFVYPVDFSSLQRRGHYLLSVAGARSPSFAIGDARTLFGPLADRAVRFFQAQRDGQNVIPGPLHRAPAHLLDRRAALYTQPSYRGLKLTAALHATGQRVDVSGGWFDAGDYLKFAETASFDDILALFTLREFGAGVTDRAALTSEARYGIEWLSKLWDARRRVLYYQVGLGDGNGARVLGDHDLWRLPQADDRRNPRPGSANYYVTYRPVFAANSPGRPISPNLAGRVAAAFALCAQVFAHDDHALAERCLRNGQSIYALADTQPRGQLLTASPHAYYTESEYRDDLELGAVELFRAERMLGSGSGNESGSRTDARANPYTYLNDAGRWADAYISSPTNGRDSLNLYDVSSIAHFDLFGVLSSPAFNHLQTVGLPGVNVATDPASLLKDSADQLALARRLGQSDPFRLSNTSGNLDTVPHALGYAIQARLYDLLIHRPLYEDFAQTQLDWVLGQNAWGSSFVVGAGSTFPHCLAHQVANLSGSLSGAPPLLLGAAIDGPNDPASLRGRGAPDGFRSCPSPGVADRFAPFNTGRLAYTDDVRSFSTSEPSDDFSVLALLAFAQQASQG